MMDTESTQFSINSKLTHLKALVSLFCFSCSFVCFWIELLFSFLCRDVDEKKIVVIKSCALGVFRRISMHAFVYVVPWLFVVVDFSITMAVATHCLDALLCVHDDVLIYIFWFYICCILYAMHTYEQRQAATCMKFVLRVVYNRPVLFIVSAILISIFT